MRSKELDDPQKPSNFFGEDCMKRLDSSCWATFGNVAIVAAMVVVVVFVFAEYQGHKHLGLLDPSFESPRHDSAPVQLGPQTRSATSAEAEIPGGTNGQRSVLS